MVKYHKECVWVWECCCGNVNEEEIDPKRFNSVVCQDCGSVFEDFEEE
jgi:hypothetical protein